MTTTDEHLIIPTQTRISFLDGPVGQGAHAEYSMRVAAPGLDPGPVPPGPRTSDDPVAAGYQRFTLDPESVVGVYPPPDSAADFTHVLPHIELTPATLPWEHSVGSAHSAGTPWLALLLITDDELVATRTGTVEQVLSLTDHNVLGPRIDLAGIPPTLRTSRCTTVDVPLDIAAAVLPRPAEALHLAFTRRVSTAGRKLSNYVVVVTNRLARRDARYAAHLVSLEGHGDSYLSTGDQGTANAVVRFVSLWSWSFTSQPADRRTTPATLASPRHAASACAPLAAGWMPVPAKSPNGEEVVCWYRGPFTGSSDAVGHDGDGGVDLSYAAAFELGRLLAMGHGRFDQLPDRVRARYRSPAALIEQLVADGSLDAARRQRHTPLTDRP